MTVGVTKVAIWNRNTGFQSTTLDQLWRERDYKWLKCLRQPLTRQSRPALRLTQSSPKLLPPENQRVWTMCFLVRKAREKHREVTSEDFGGPPWHLDKNQVNNVLPFLTAWDCLPAAGRHQPLLEATHTWYPVMLALFRRGRGVRLSTPCILQPLPNVWLSISMTDGQAHRCETLWSESHRQNALSHQPISSGQGSAHHWSSGPRRSDVWLSGSRQIVSLIIPDGYRTHETQDWGGHPRVMALGSSSKASVD